ncbi:fibronectin type III domain-containing protein [Mucilaginibacter pedocola]|uniref:Fibronectin type-III domain-containing protein n=1 Tax=Mucilaginibacter pedocola TaxID=1792845 RepID=A0A1S9PF23_9SPHI|nr:hypothetical protein [Mucilaginibacter pedocola]OOQ59546.1 hypothetical protein BC343_05085 [Mucilaginibacter pedocola]
MRNIFIAAMMLLTITNATAQETAPKTAYAGGNAAFVYHAFPPASPKAPDNGFTGVKLEREDLAAPGKWVTISETHFPENAGELMLNYSRAARFFPGAAELRFDPAASFSKYQRYKTLDSLANELAYTPEQMAFNILLADTTVQKGHSYRYKVSQSGAPNGKWFYTNNIKYPDVIDTKKPVYARRQVEQAAIRIEWAAKGEFRPMKMRVYRRSDNDKEFSEIRPYTSVDLKGDSIKYSIRDENVVYSNMYHYYITPVNDFGGGGNIVSDTVHATCMESRNLLSPQYVIAGPDSAKQAVVVRYRLPEPQYIGSVAIMRSANYDKGYERVGLNAATDSTFTDNRIEPGVKYYYYLVMTDKMGRNATRSVKTFGFYQSAGNDFPARFVRAERKGKTVLLSWQYPDERMSGYYVYRCEGIGGQMKRLTVLLRENDSLYVDTFKFRPGFTYGYAVRSENLSNKESRNSNIAYIRPAGADSDMVAPKDIQAAAQGNAIRLTWADLRQTNNTVSAYRIVRFTSGETQPQLLQANYPSAFSTYVDSTAVEGKSYVYAIAAVINGSVSLANQSNTVQLRVENMPPPAALTAYSSAKGVNLRWGKVVDERVKYFVIYRYVNGGQPAAIATLPANTYAYTDAAAAKGVSNYYFIRSAGADKVASAKSSNEAFAD